LRGILQKPVSINPEVSHSVATVFQFQHHKNRTGKQSFARQTRSLIAGITPGDDLETKSADKKIPATAKPARVFL
jgi:hypothetical protein